MTFDEVRAIRTLRPLSDDDLRALMDFGEQSKHAHGADVFTQGTPCTTARMVLSGKLKLTVTAGGEPSQVGEIWPGELVGEAAFYDISVPNECGAEAIGEVIVLDIDGAKIGEASGSHAVAALEAHLIQTLARQVKTNDLGIRKGWQEIRSAQARLAADEAAEADARAAAAELRSRPRRPKPTPEPNLVDKISSFFFGGR
jgi:CRP-like cAMP-binding protein